MKHFTTQVSYHFNQALIWQKFTKTGLNEKKKLQFDYICKKKQYIHFFFFKYLSGILKWKNNLETGILTLIVITDFFFFSIEDVDIFFPLIVQYIFQVFEDIRPYILLEMRNACFITRSSTLINSAKLMNYTVAMVITNNGAIALYEHVHSGSTGTWYRCWNMLSTIKNIWKSIQIIVLLCFK